MQRVDERSCSYVCTYIRIYSVGGSSLPSDRGCQPQVKDPPPTHLLPSSTLGGSFSRTPGDPPPVEPLFSPPFQLIFICLSTRTHAQLTGSRVQVAGLPVEHADHSRVSTIRRRRRQILRFNVAVCAVDRSNQEPPHPRQLDDGNSHGDRGRAAVPQRRWSPKPIRIAPAENPGAPTRH